MNKKFEDKFKESLKKNQPKFEQKEEVWNNISTEVFSKKEERKKMKKNRKNWFLSSAIAASICGVMVLGTSHGTAMMDNIKEFFSPEKETIKSIEGMDEELHYHLHESENKSTDGFSEYIIYIEEGYTSQYNEKEKHEVIVFDDQAEGYPEVSMKIEELVNIPFEDAIVHHKELLSEEYITVRKENTDIIADGIVFYSYSDTNWNSEYVKTYIIDNQKDGSFIITQTLFLEAAEGHGARFDHMISEFQILE